MNLNNPLQLRSKTSLLWLALLLLPILGCRGCNSDPQNTTQDPNAKNKNQKQRLVADATIEQIKAALAAHQESEKSRREAMNHPVFWWVWSLFAVPLGIWWALVMTDTFLTSVSWGIPDLPEAVKPWASTIFGSIFGSGGAVAGIQIIAGAIRGRK